MATNPKSSKAKASSEGETRKPGRPRLPPGEVRGVHAFRIKPAVWAEVLEWIPEGERSDVVSRALKREVVKRQKAKLHDEMLAEEGFPTGE